MPDDTAKIELANLVIRKAGLFRTIRNELHKRDHSYWTELTEILEAVEDARKLPSSKEPA